MSGYEFLECEATGHGYDLKMKFLVDGEPRYLYYAEMPDRNFVRGWSIFEISSENYEANKREPFIRFVGTFSGDNQYRANDFVYRALQKGLFVQSKWDVFYGDIYLVKEIKKERPKLEYTEIHGNYFEAHLDDDSTHYLYRKMIFVQCGKDTFGSYTRYYEIEKDVFIAHSDEKASAKNELPLYIRYLGAFPSPANNTTSWYDKEKNTLYQALTKNMSIYPYVRKDAITLRRRPCPLHEPLEIPASVHDHDSNEKYYYTLWKVLLDGQDVVYLLLIQAKEGDPSVKVYEIGENQFRNEYRSYYTSTAEGFHRIVEIDDSPERRFNIFFDPLNAFYKIQSEPEHGGISLTETLDAPKEYVRLVCTLPDFPDVFSEKDCQCLHAYLRGDGEAGVQA